MTLFLLLFYSVYLMNDDKKQQRAKTFPVWRHETFVNAGKTQMPVNFVTSYRLHLIQSESMENNNMPIIPNLVAGSVHLFSIIMISKHKIIQCFRSSRTKIEETNSASSIYFFFLIKKLLKALMKDVPNAQ